MVSHATNPNIGLGKFVRTDTVRLRWNALLKETGLDKRTKRGGIEGAGKFALYHLHTLRKFYRTNSRLPEDEREFMMGHKGKNLASSHYRPDPRDVFEEYKKNT